MLVMLAHGCVSIVLNSTVDSLLETIHFCDCELGLDCSNFLLNIWVGSHLSQVIVSAIAISACLCCFEPVFA